MFGSRYKVSKTSSKQQQKQHIQRQYAEMRFIIHARQENILKIQGPAEKPDDF